MNNKNKLDFSDGLNVLISNLTQNKVLKKLQWILLSNGLTEFDENLIFFGLKAGETIPAFVAKLPRLPKNIEVIQVEYVMLKDVWKCLGDKASHYIPKPITLSVVQGQPVLITTYVHGENLLRLRIAQNKKNFLPFSIEVAKSLRGLLDGTLSELRDDDKSSNYNLTSRIKKFIEMYQPNPNVVKELYAVEQKILSDAENYSKRILIHGDFWHGNIIRNTKNKSLMMVDWQYARWTHDASQDVYLFLLAGALSTTRYDDDPKTRAKDTVKVLIDWKEDIIKEYLAAFGTPFDYNLLSLRLGMLYCCIEKAVRASIELGFDRKEDLVWYYIFCELLKWFEQDNVN